MPPPGELATTITFYDTLRLDIQRSFKHVVEGVARVERAFPDSFEVKVAKVIAVLQVLDDFPISRENIAALLHPRVESPSQFESVKAAVAQLMEEKAVHLNEVDGKLRFMSEAVAVKWKPPRSRSPCSTASAESSQRKTHPDFHAPAGSPVGGNPALLASA